MELKATRYAIDEHGVATVWLHRPHRHNAWTARMHAEYRWIMAELAEDANARVVVLTGSGDTFCVGADSKALAGYVDKGSFDPMLDADARRPGYGVHPTLDEDIVWQLGYPLPIICAVNGSCAGVGLALAAYSDIRFGLAGAKVTTATPALAMPAEYGLSWILPRIVGLTHAADILLSGRVLRAEELAAMGFFNAVHGEAELAAAVQSYARQLARLSPEAVRTTKRQLYDDLLSSDPGSSSRESKEHISRLMAHPDYAEGVAALTEKRPPRFGR